MGLAAEFEIKQNVAGKIIASLAELGAQEVKKNGIFTFPGLCRIKTRVKPATKACKKEIFGEMRMVKAKPARTIVGIPGGGFEAERLRLLACLCIVSPWICCGVVRRRRVARIRSNLLYMSGSLEVGERDQK